MSELFSQSRSAAGSRSILSLMRDDGEQLGRFKVRSLMRELDLVSKQPGSHAYKRATIERLDIPNILNREFNVPAPNQVWCGDITYIWAQGKWHYLAVVLDLCARLVVDWALSKKPDAELVTKALDMAYEQRGRPQGLLFHSDQGSQGGFNRSSQHWIVVQTADSMTLGHSAHDHLDTRSMLTWTPDPRPLGQAVGAQRRRLALLV
ncbi:putative transposase [Pseudomonas fluorescens]|nr:putative transposase [Pseudomonas fluorescens]MCP1489847.1 putative transposase [Pseudomonas fluorescens]